MELQCYAQYRNETIGTFHTVRHHINIPYSSTNVVLWKEKKNDRRLEHEEREGGRKNVSFNIARYEVIEKVFNSTEMTITESVCCQINIFASSCSLLKKKGVKKGHNTHIVCHAIWHTSLLHDILQFGRLAKIL